MATCFSSSRPRSSIRSWGTPPSPSFPIVIPPGLEASKTFGTYNVRMGGSHWRNDPDGVAAIRWWREEGASFESGAGVVDGDRFCRYRGWHISIRSPRLFSRVKVICLARTSEPTLAPWNIGNYRIDFRDGRVLIDAAHPLVFFIFRGREEALRWFIFGSHRVYRAPFSGASCAIISTSPMSMNCSRSSKRVRSDPASYRGEGLHRPIDGRQPRATYLKSKLHNAGARLFQVLDIVIPGGRSFVFRGRERISSASHREQVSLPPPPPRSKDARSAAETS